MCRDPNKLSRRYIGVLPNYLIVTLVCRDHNKLSRCYIGVLPNYLIVIMVHHDPNNYITSLLH